MAEASQPSVIRDGEATYEKRGVPVSVTDQVGHPASTEEVDFVAQAPGPMERLILGIFVVVPLAAVLVGIPLAFVNGWVRWLDIAMLAVLYVVGVHGITIGYHRMFTHGAFQAGPRMRATLALAGSLAIEGRVIDWVADHRAHHQMSDKEGDPHSPWEFGRGGWGLFKGLIHAHVGWIFTFRGTDARKYAPDLLADRTVDRISRWWPAVALVSMVVPTAIGYALDGWAGAAMAFFWVTVVRVALVHHMTWSINSVCHVWGKRPFRTRDESRNVAWLSWFSGGESWHNYHHADPSSARHGVLPRQIDTSAAVIRLLERLGWVHSVKWPTQERIESRRSRQDVVSTPAQ